MEPGRRIGEGKWLATSSPPMMPMVFWASLVPWERENAAAEPSWARRNQRSTEP